MSKSSKYLIAVVALVAANAFFFIAGNQKSSKELKNYFQSEDFSKVSVFILMNDENSINLQRMENGWSLNNQYTADAGFVNTLISVLERVEIGRTIESWEQPVLGEVEVIFDADSRIKFQFATNPNQTKTYFISAGVAKEVAVPGYRDNVADIFTLHPDQWRDRLIVDASWRTIQRIDVESEQENGFNIQFNDDFFVVNEQIPADSSAVINYLNQFQQFQANEMISIGRFPKLDSIAQLEPLAVISIDHIRSEELFQLTIYPDTNRHGYHLAINKQGDRMVIDAGRVRQMLTDPDQLN